MFKYYLSLLSPRYNKQLTLKYMYLKPCIKLNLWDHEQSKQPDHLAANVFILHTDWPRYFPII